MYVYVATCGYLYPQSKFLAKCGVRFCENLCEKFIVKCKGKFCLSDTNLSVNNKVGVFLLRILFLW